MLPPTEVELQDIHRVVFGDSGITHTKPPISAYVEHYHTVVRPYADTSADAVIAIAAPALKIHSDLVHCVKTLQEHTEDTVDDFVSHSAILQGISGFREREHVINTGINILFMVDCGLRVYHSAEYRDRNLGHVRWSGDITFSEFLKETFQAQGIGLSAKQPSVLARPGLDLSMHKVSLKAWKLYKRYDIEIKPTDNLLEHLYYNPKARSLKVFHHVSFLRSQLHRTIDDPLTIGFEQSLQRGALPPKLVLETLLTLHRILFPTFEDDRSDTFLGKMIKRGFDPDAQFIGYVREDYDRSDTDYEYWEKD